MFLIPTWEQTNKNQLLLKGSKCLVSKTTFRETGDKKALRLEQYFHTQVDNVLLVRILQRNKTGQIYTERGREILIRN